MIEPSPLDRYDLGKRPAFLGGSVAETPDVLRVRALPPRPDMSPEQAEALSRILCPRGTGSLRLHQAAALRELYEVGGLVAPLRVGGGKCWGAGTRLLRYDGSAVAVEDVRVGDTLMGPDSKPRTVTATTAGHAPMYRIIPVKGDPWTCNGPHVLTVVDSVSGVVTDVPLDEYLTWSKKRQAEAKLFQPEQIDFAPRREPALDPYVLGVWLGDGTKAMRCFTVTKPDREIGDALGAEARRWGLNLREFNPPGKCTHWRITNRKGAPNPILHHLRDLMRPGVRIPDDYRLGSAAVRRQVLAGLLDTDGYLNKSGYEIVQVNTAIADDIAFVARSLGFRVTERDKYVGGVAYRRLFVSGDVSQLPLRIPRKQAPPRRQKKNPLRTGFRVEPAGEGAYFGFSLHGPDRRCLLADFTVTHNSLICLLAKVVTGSQRCVLVTKAPCIDEMTREFSAMHRAGWDVRLPHMISYAKLGRQSAEHELVRLAPDLLIFDEAHKLSNLRSAASVRRVARAIHLLRPRVAMLSGSMLGDELMRYWHMLVWALGANAPVPLTHGEAKQWAQALDGDTGGLARVELGALRSLGDFHEHMRSRRGIVPTLGGDCPAEIVLRRWEPALPDALEQMITEVEATGTRPDGELLEDTEKADCVLQLSQGFWYRWDPSPPDAWLEPRRAWHRYVRSVVEAHVDGFDSPLAVVRGLDRPCSGGQVVRGRDVLPQYQALVQQCEASDPYFEPPEDWLGPEYERVMPVEPYRGAEPPDADIGRQLLASWRAVRDTYEPTVVPEWVDDAPLRAAVAHALAGDPCLVWTRHRAAGHRMQQLGLPYFGGGTDPHTAVGRSIALSTSAHGTGKNLQAWARNLVLTLPANAITAEQLMGRTHRPGQTSLKVSFDIAACTRYQQDVLDRVQRQAKADGHAAGIEYKITKGRWRS